MVFKPTNGKSIKLKSVTDFSFAREGECLQVIASKPDSIDSVFVYMIPFKEFKSKAIYSAKGYAKNPAVDRAGKQMSFLASTDTSQNKMWSLMFYDIAKNKLSVAVDSNSKELPKNWCPLPNGSVKFSDDGKRLFFETAKKPDEPAKDTLTDEEKCKVDVWAWDDDRLQSQQIHDLDKDLKQTYLAVYDIASSQIFQLGDPDLESVSTVNKGNGDYAIGYDDKPYSISASWESPSRRDAYLVNLKTGERKLLLKNVKRSVTLSPAAQYVLFFTNEDSCWNVFRIKNNDFIKFPKPAGVCFADEEYDMPSITPAYGIAGWLKDEKYVLINDRYDIWKFDLTNKVKPVCITSAEGRKNKTEYRYQKLNKDDEWIDAKSPILLKTYNEKSKAEGYARITLSKLAAPEEMLKANARITGFVKAKDEDLFILQKQSVKDYPDLWLADVKFVNPAERITNANPQQKDYNWATVESVYWKAYDGKDLEGMLYKPENFNPAKKYPVIVYFYEKNSDNFNTHYVPSPSRSIVNPTVYSSNGYLVFVPDIVYKKGQPGKDAYNCIMSGVDKIVKLSYVDSLHMALQGQSWGGYQTAYLITQTNRFCAAMAGAAVSNMTSAYGGIRLESGVVRMHQYENSQSRIGYTLWDSLQLYIQNSPLFYADKIKTPLLMMNNDNDGAVPWQQGIELLCAMRRLQKPAWMLVYNGEEHNLTKRPTRQDLSIRMMQFFDHYLKGAPAPQWMIDGIPAVEKGKKFGYEISK
ncbi:MAG: prolyl oligopeptidase family serine peptidase [Bacteroidota bacterium]